MTESQLQHACVMWFNATYRHQASLVHVPNQRQQSARQGAVWRGLGVVAGWPDLQVVAGGKILLIELKTTEGVLSKAQKDLHATLKAQGTDVLVVRSLEEFKAVVSEWLG